VSEIQQLTWLFPEESQEQPGVLGLFMAASALLSLALLLRVAGPEDGVEPGLGVLDGSELVVVLVFHIEELVAVEADAPQDLPGELDQTVVVDGLGEGDVPEMSGALGLG
jgi:hypothetical protein